MPTGSNPTSYIAQDSWTKGESNNSLSTSRHLPDGMHLWLHGLKAWASRARKPNYEASCQGHFPGSSVCNLNRTVHTEHHCLTETTTTDLRVAKGEQRGKGQAAGRKPAHTRRERSRVCMSGAQPVFRKIHSMTSTPSPIQPCHQGSWQS